jgi:hypothetical protein
MVVAAGPNLGRPKFAWTTPERQIAVEAVA